MSDNHSRVLEARRLMKLIDFRGLSPRDSRFVWTIDRRLNNGRGDEVVVISEKDIYWLRDIKDRCLERS